MEKIKDALKFIVYTAVIFSISFFAMNFSAYAAIMQNYFNPEALKQEEAQINKAVAPKETKQVLLDETVHKKEIRKQFPKLAMQVSPPGNYIIIPKIGKTAPIVEMENDLALNTLPGEFEKEVQDALQGGVLHYPGTALPGQYGNTFITGHSSYYFWDPGKYKDVFALLEKLEVGDIYYIYYNQQKYTYKVREKKVVSPDNIEVLNQPKDRKISTLMTCTPVGTAINRLILVADEINDFQDLYAGGYS